MMNVESDLRQVAMVDDLIHQIVHFLPLNDLLLSASLVCHNWHQIIESDEWLWKIQVESLGWPQTQQQQQQHNKIPTTITLPTRTTKCLSWKQFFTVLRRMESNLYVYTNSHWGVEHCGHLLNELIGVDKDQFVREQRRNRSDSAGKVCVLESKPLIQCLKMQEYIIGEKNVNALTEIAITPHSTLLYYNEYFTQREDRIVDAEFNSTTMNTTLKASNHLYGVAVLNDESHSFDQVIRQLRIACDLPYITADKITWMAHYSGECICFKSELLSECSSVITSLRSVGLGVKLRLLDSDALYMIQQAYHSGRCEPLLKQLTTTTTSEEDNQEYCVVLSRDYLRRSTDIISEFERLLSLNAEDALKLLFCIFTMGSYSIFHGSKNEATRIYDYLNKRLYNVMLMTSKEYNDSNDIRDSFSEADLEEEYDGEGVYDESPVNYVDFNRDEGDDFGEQEEDEAMIDEALMDFINNGMEHDDDDDEEGGNASDDF